MKYTVLIITVFMCTLKLSSKELTIDMLNKRDDGQRMVYSQDSRSRIR